MRSTEPTGGRGDLDDWAGIDRSAVERSVRRLQEQIFRASQNGETAKVRNLQQLIVRSSAAKLLAIRQVTQINRGRKTPGIDGKVCRLPPHRLALFRKGRDRGHPRIHVTLARKGSSQWVLDADIAKCFGAIDHAALLARVPVFAARRHISPLLANIALDGMERLFGSQRRNGRTICPSARKGNYKGVSLIRYADDFVVTPRAREVLEDYVIPRLTDFLVGRGLSLSETKTRIVHIGDGFNFLGFTIRRFPNGKHGAVGGSPGTLR